MEDRAKWIVAKYRWYGFVDEVSLRSDTELVQVVCVAGGSGEGSMLGWHACCCVLCVSFGLTCELVSCYY